MIRTPWLSEYATDLVGILISALLLLAYHVYLRVRLQHDPSYTIQAVNRAARTAWVETIMADDRHAVLAVQTLRNSTMAATFLSSTSVLLIIGTLTLSGQYDRLSSTWHLLNLAGSAHPGLWIAKLLFLLTDFFIAFFSFAMSVRLYNHVGYQINVPPAARDRALTPANVAVHLNRAGYYYSIGMRSYYFAVPLVFWLFGPVFMILATLIVIAVLYHLDRAPRSAKTDVPPGI